MKHTRTVYHIFEGWQVLRSGKTADFIAIAVTTLLFLLIIATSVRLLFQMTTNQTEEIGQLQLENIQSELSGGIANAETMTKQLAIETEEMLSSGSSREQIAYFFARQKKTQLSLSKGACVNVYIADSEWAFIPDFTVPEDFHVQERLWYKGAAAQPGNVYVTDPYLDAASGQMCYTMSMMLPDGKTVVGLDFNFSNLQKSLMKMTSDAGRTALIVSKSGRIISYSDMSLVGEKISRKLPEYEPILKSVLTEGKMSSFPAELDGRHHTIFSSEAGNGWYMILAVDNWALYKDIYLQVALAIALSLFMLVMIVLFYMDSVKSRILAEQALQVKEEFLSRISTELRSPLSRILKLSHVDSLDSEGSVEKNAAAVRESALQLSDMLDNIFSFGAIVNSGKEKEQEASDIKMDLAKTSRYARGGIVVALCLSMTVNLALCVNATVNWGDTKMHREVDSYDYQLSNWIAKHRSILSMFANMIAEHPALLENYDEAVTWMNDIAQNYPEISVCYLTNPYKEHTVIMNNGWQPDANWHVEDRQWYIDTEKSEDGFNISAPYYDEQTGYYCVTLSQIVYGKNEEFLGIFGIDFYLDQLIHVLGESYSKDGYAFLVDRDGIIINHPNNAYQMSTVHMTDIVGTEYRDVYTKNQIDSLRDYSDTLVSCLAKKSASSDFTIIVANNWWNMYGNIVLVGAMFLLLLGLSITVVTLLINRLLRWQHFVNLKIQKSAEHAMAADKAKSQFLAQMSHEIRTPINAILGMNEIVLRESNDKDILECSTVIQNAGKTLLTLINSILDFSKIEDGKMEIVPVPYELLPMIDDLVNMISERARKKGLSLVTEISPKLPRSLYGDDVRIRQIITNLLTNAVKYANTGTVTLRMEREDLDEDTLVLKVAVIDTGIGIKQEDMDKLFQSFQRLDEEKNRNIEGTGLGISIVQKLLMMMGSKLEVSSTYGKGSVFSFSLTQKIIDGAPIGSFEEQRNKLQVVEKAETYLRAPDAKILVVDDTSTNLMVIRGLLKRSGIVPDLAESGEECLSLAAKNHYHIIFLDHMMPGMDGVETLKRLREENLLPMETVVIALTANAVSGAREEYLAAGFDDYLSKPIDTEQLESMIAKYLPEQMVSYEKAGSSAANVPSTESKIAGNSEKNPSAEGFSEEETATLKELCPDLDLSSGLSHCMGLKDLFLNVAEDYQKGNRAEKIEALYEAKDIKGYRIAVHALKSTSGTLGANRLEQMAKEQEMAAKAEDWETVMQNHKALMDAYAQLRLGLGKWLAEL